MFWLCVNVREGNFRISLIRFCRLLLFLYSRKDSELPTTPGSDLAMYMLDAIEMLLLRVDSVDIVSGLRRRDSSLSALLPFEPSVFEEFNLITKKCLKGGENAFNGFLKFENSLKDKFCMQLP